MNGAVRSSASAGAPPIKFTVTLGHYAKFVSN